MLRLMLVCVALSGALKTEQAPVVGRPSEHFYGAVGEHVQIAMRAAPTRVRVEDPIVLTIAVMGAANVGQIERPDLRRLDEYSSRFYIDDLPEESAPAGQRLFRYRLRPKNEHVDAVPPLLFHYYDPKLSYFATTATPEPISLSISPRDPPASMPADDPIVAGPNWLFNTPTDQAILRDDRGGFHFASSTIGIVASLSLPAFGFAVWLVLWRRLNPDAAKLAGLRRAHAVRIALDDLRRLADLPRDQLGTRVAAIVRGFLRERLELPARCATAGEIGEFLHETELPAALVARVVEFFRACDLARFGPPETTLTGLTRNAERLILDVEEGQ